MTGNQMWKRHSFLLSAIISSVLVIWLTEEKHAAVFNANRLMIHLTSVWNNIWKWPEWKEQNKKSLVHKCIKKKKKNSKKTVSPDWKTFDLNTPLWSTDRLWTVFLCSSAENKTWEGKKEEKGSDIRTQTVGQEALQTEASSGFRRRAVIESQRDIEKPHHCLFMNMSEAVSIFWLRYGTDLLKRHNDIPETDHSTQGSSHPQTNARPIQIISSSTKLVAHWHCERAAFVEHYPVLGGGATKSGL